MSTVSKQNGRKAIKLLAAQRALYSQAKRYWALTLILNIIVLPSLSVFVVYNQRYAAFVAIFGITLLLLNGLLILLIQQHIRTAATVQELFDNYVLGIPLNAIIVDQPNLDETVAYWSTRYLSRHTDKRLKDWYATSLKTMPQTLATLTGQTINSWWDSGLRTTYTFLLCTTAILITGLLFTLGLMRNLDLESFVLIVMVPITAPVQILASECYKNIQAASRAQKNCNRAKILSEQSKSKTIAIADIRALQDSIFVHRVSSPLVFDFIYWLTRKQNELTMKKAYRADGRGKP